jgi:hypothetical protein
MPDPTMSPTLQEDGTDPIWRSTLMVWLKSEYLDHENYFRLNSAYAEYEGASWPLGLGLPPDPATGLLTEVLVIDAVFNEDVKRAWQLPWHYSKLRIEIPPRRSGANFVIRNVGHWNGDAGRFQDIMAPVTIPKRSAREAVVEKIYALSPFCVIAQSWIDDRRPQRFSGIVETDIVLFYTFETFIQECLALEAFRKGIEIEKIIASYDHVYSNVWRPEAIPSRPEEFRLSGLVGSSFDWSQILTTAKSMELARQDKQGFPMRALRAQLYHFRRQTHLMVAIAAACHGLRALDRVDTRTPLVELMQSPPTHGQLASSWLRHMLGGYDHAAECTRLLVHLAKRYGIDLAPGDVGLFLSTAERLPRTAAEHSVASFRGVGRHGPQTHDRYRWALFDSSLEDDSLLSWREKLTRFASASSER